MSHYPTLACHGKQTPVRLPVSNLPAGNFVSFQHILRTHPACFVPCFAFARDGFDFVVKVPVSASAVKYLTLKPKACACWIEQDALAYVLG
jgi:hypothetical protein